MARPEPAEPAVDERGLIEAAQRDPARFAGLYDEHFERVYAYIARRVTARADVEDLTSEVFHRALANLKGFEWRGVPFVAWLYRIAANAIADHRKEATREQGVVLEGAIVEARSAEAEDHARLYRLVRGLPAGQRRAIELRFAGEMGVGEVAREMGRSEGAVKQLQYRGLETLRERMGVRHG
jgi:RNA polymerase sigma-70 factor (ECF subfamily)